MQKKLIPGIMCLLVFLFGGTAFGTNGKIPVFQPTAITNPGSYYLTGDIGGNIQVDFSGVTLDLNGHTVNGNIQVDSGSTGVSDIRITNGRINGTLDASNGGIDFRFDNLQLFGSIIYLMGMQFSIHDCITQNIDISNCMNGKVFNCTVQSAPADAIMMNGCSSVQVVYNTVMDNWGGNGINASNCWSCDISNNVISSNNLSGIYLNNSNSNKIYFNNSSGNMADGITVDASSVNNDISNNTLCGNSFCGMSVIASSASNVIENNTASGNGTDGIMLDATTLNNIYGNNRAVGNAGLSYNDIGTNSPVCYDGVVCTAPTNN